MGYIWNEAPKQFSRPWVLASCPKSTSLGPVCEQCVCVGGIVTCDIIWIKMQRVFATAQSGKAV